MNPDDIPPLVADLPLQQPNSGVWVARYSDGSGISTHRCEVDAHRAANGTGRDVVFVPWGDDLLRDGTAAS